MKSLAILITSIFILSSCVISDTSSSFGQYKATKLYNKTDESVSFIVSDDESFLDLQNWLNTDDTKYHANLTLGFSKQLNKKVTSLLNKKKIKFTTSKHKSDLLQIELFSEITQLVKCKDNSFGCANNSNLLNMVRDKNQLISPSVSKNVKSYTLN
ncbi:MAG: hypothetical protein J0H68_06945 [Sphingobacteriia bacterium]|nr:hypothetical protein [Sphingobacteriia bacterium]